MEIRVNYVKFGSGALSGKMLLVMIVKIYKIMLILSKG